MISMKLDPAKSAPGEAQPLMADAPVYPWGLQLRQEEDQLAQLGIKALPAVGAKVRVVAMAEVTAVSQNQEQGGEVCRCVTLQITDMDPPGASGGMYDRSNMAP